MQHETFINVIKGTILRLSLTQMIRNEALLLGVIRDQLQCHSGYGERMGTIKQSEGCPDGLMTIGDSQERSL